MGIAGCGQEDRDAKEREETYIEPTTLMDYKERNGSAMTGLAIDSMGLLFAATCTLDGAREVHNVPDTVCSVVMNRMRRLIMVCQELKLSMYWIWDGRAHEGKAVRDNLLCTQAHSPRPPHPTFSTRAQVTQASRRKASTNALKEAKRLLAQKDVPLEEQAEHRAKLVRAWQTSARINTRIIRRESS